MVSLLKRLFSQEDAFEGVPTQQVNLEKSSEVGLVWNLFTELRKEVVEEKKIRTQILQVKITLVSAGIGVIAANAGTVPLELFVVPAFAAVFFDFLINSTGFSIKRIGYYCRTHLEPNLNKAFKNSNPSGEMLWWEDFLAQGELWSPSALFGHLGHTGLAISVAVIALLIQSDWRLSAPLIVAMVGLFIYDIVLFRRTKKIAVLKRSNVE
jgi:hypothetical protein